VVRRIADEVAVLYAGQIVEQGGNVNPYTGVANNRFWAKRTMTAGSADSSYDYSQ